jgi:hypothetical protein
VNAASRKVAKDIFSLGISAGFLAWCIWDAVEFLTAGVDSLRGTLFSYFPAHWRWWIHVLFLVGSTSLSLALIVRYSKRVFQRPNREM